MEIYNKKDNQNLITGANETGNKLLDTNKIPDVNKTAADSDLHDEGIDLVGSGVNEDNEFTGTEAPANESEPPVAPETPKLPTTTPGVITPPPSNIPFVPSVKNDPSIKPVRTFKSDAEEAVRYKNISAIDIAVAEQKKKEITPIEYIEPKQSHPGIFVATALIVMLAIALGWFYWFKTSQKTEKNTPVQVSVETIIPYTIIPYTKGSTLLLRADSDPLVLIGAKLGVSNAGLGNVYAIIPTLATTKTAPADISIVLGFTHISSRLLRSLSPVYMIGTYTYDVNSPFIILKNTFFQNAFAGMLDWEKDLRNDLLPLIRVSYPNEDPITANTDIFEDIVVSNIDTRILKNSEGKIILAYAFTDTETLVIATSESALKYVLDRLLTVRSVQ